MTSELRVRACRLGLAAPWLLASACGTHVTNLANSEDAAIAISDAGPQFQLDDAGVVLCGAAPCACSDGIDNDRDGLTDGFDPECTGASDNFEDSFATGIRGEDKSGKCEGCFFDGNPGNGNDVCRRASSCGRDGTSSGGNGSCRSCTVDSTCEDGCTPLVPNGCDCFGCCGVWQAGVVHDVVLGDSSCKAEADALGDPQRCTPCVQAQDCVNPCGTCELCPGRTLADLPASCASATGPGYACDELKPCTRSSDCGPLAYCQLGCCLAIGI
jgi:hypothetical protein